jgi:hypothetical protein
MKKTLVAISAALALATTGAVAQDVAGGTGAKESTVGGVTVSTIAAGAVAAAVIAAVVSNSSGASLPGGPIEEECDLGETLVGGVCVPNGGTTTVTSTTPSTVTVTVTTTGL